MRFAYADPPYPGLAHYYRDHPDYVGEVDLAELLSRLQHYDGWALSTSSEGLVEVLDICPTIPVVPRVAAWFRGSRPGKSCWPKQAWEPVVFAGGRRLPSLSAADDALVHAARARTTDPGHVIGAKPAAFCSWMFGLLGALPGDTLDDLYPGSGGVARAWNIYASAPATTDTSGRAASDTSPRCGCDASRGDDGDASRLEHGDASLLEEGHASQPGGPDALPRWMRDASRGSRRDGSLHHGQNHGCGQRADGDD